MKTAMVNTLIEEFFIDCIWPNRLWGLLNCIPKSTPQFCGMLYL